MVPITSSIFVTIFVTIICVGLLVVIFITRKELKQERQKKEDSDKSVVYLSCQIKMLAIKSKSEELRDQASRANRGGIWRRISKTVLKGILLYTRISGFPFPDIDFSFPDISDIGDLPEDFDIPDDYDFDIPDDYDFGQFFIGFEDVPDVNAQKLDSISLANLERYETQLDHILQELDRTLANFDN